jgi:hypothetical protein
MSIHIKIQSLKIFKGRLFYLWCPKKSWRFFLGALITLKIVKNGLEMRKLCMALQSLNGQKVKKVPHPTQRNHSENT